MRRMQTESRFYNRLVSNVGNGICRCGWPISPELSLLLLEYLPASNLRRGDSLIDRLKQNSQLKWEIIRIIRIGMRPKLVSVQITFL